jgi:DNA-binding transcriptional ArsR family regulator
MPSQNATRNGHPANGISSRDRNGIASRHDSGRHDSVPVDWEQLARATAHPLRVSILEILGIDGGRTLSPTELSRELQIPLSNTNYHVTELAKANLIELVRRRQVRGATEHFYRIPVEVPASSGSANRAAEKRASALAPALTVPARAE